MNRRTLSWLVLGVLVFLAAGALDAGWRRLAELVHPSEELRALETFDCAWRIVDEEHFDPDHNGVDWAAVREELRPRAARAADREALRAVLRDMLARLRQSHFGLIPRESLGAGAAGSKEHPAGTCGLDLRWIDGELVVVSVDTDGPAARAGIAPGWVLRAEVGVKGNQRPEADIRQVALGVVDGPVGSRIELTFTDLERHEHALGLERVARDVPTYDSASIETCFPTWHQERVVRDGRVIGVLCFSMWVAPLLAPLDEALLELRDCDALVLDLRGNIGGETEMMKALAGHFFDHEVSLGTMLLRHGSQDLPVEPRRRFGEREVEPFLGPLLLLVDGVSGSCSEVFAGGMRALERVTVIGERTAGAALPATLSPLPNGDSLRHAFARITNAHGDQLEGDGVLPDVELHPTRADWASGNDVTFEAALRRIESDAGR